MIAVAVDACRRRSSPPADPQPVRRAARARRRASSRPVGHHRQAIALLDAQLRARRVTSVSPLRAGGGNEEHRKLVDRQRHQRLGHRDAAQRGWRAPRCRRPARLGTGAAARVHADVGAHQPQQLEQPGARRIDADVAQQQRPLGAARQPATMKNAAEEKSAGHRASRCRAALPAVDRDACAPRARTSTPKAREHALGVIARRRRLGHARDAVRPAARRAASRISPARSPPAARSRCRAAAAPPWISHRRPPVLRLDVRAHQSQRHRHALHRAAHERGIADQRRVEALAARAAP